MLRESRLSNFLRRDDAGLRDGVLAVRAGFNGGGESIVHLSASGAYRGRS